MKIKALYITLFITIFSLTKSYAETITWHIGSSITSTPTISGNNAVAIYHTGETDVVVSVTITKQQFETINPITFALGSQNPTTTAYYVFSGSNMTMQNGTGLFNVSTYPIAVSNDSFTPGGTGTSVTIGFVAHINSPTTSIVVDNLLYLVENSGTNNVTKDQNYYLTNYPLNPLPFNRYFNPTANRHFYTLNPLELTGNNSWNLETDPGLAYNQQVTGTVPLYRYYNSSFKNHFYTLTQGTYSGYVSEGVAAFVYSGSQSNANPLYQYYSSTNGHFYTNNYNELGSGGQGYSYNGIACYLLTP